MAPEQLDGRRTPTSAPTSSRSAHCSTRSPRVVAPFEGHKSGESDRVDPDRATRLRSRPRAPTRRRRVAARARSPGRAVPREEPRRTVADGARHQAGARVDWQGGSSTGDVPGTDGASGVGAKWPRGSWRLLRRQPRLAVASYRGRVPDQPKEGDEIRGRTSGRHDDRRRKGSDAPGRVARRAPAGVRRHHGRPRSGCGLQSFGSP